MSQPSSPPDYGQLPYERPADKIKTLDVPPLDEDIKDALKKYQEAGRGHHVIGFERLPNDKRANTRARVYFTHRPAEEQVMQVFRVPQDPSSTELERITHFNMGTGRTISNFRPIQGEDWRGVWRAGGAIFTMDLDGSEAFQLWRYWEDSESQQVLPPITSELDNKPGRGRIERITHDGFRYTQLTISNSNKIMAFASTKENGKDTLIYISKLVDSSTGAQANGDIFTLPAKLVTPATSDGKTMYWGIESISLDDRYMILTKIESSSHQPLFIVNITDAAPSEPEYIALPGVIDGEDTANSYAVFSKDPSQPHLLYLITDAYGDFSSVVTYDTHSRSITHITTPDPSLNAIRPIPWDTSNLHVSEERVMFRANIDGWDELFVHPLRGIHKGETIQIRFNQEVGEVSYTADTQNGNPWRVVMSVASSKQESSLFFLDLEHALTRVQVEEENPFVCVSLNPYRQAQAIMPSYRTLPPQLIRYKSFDGLDIPVMYYHPADRQQAVPLVISIHGGPAAQSTALTSMSIHGYLINELHCAVMYPNVRGSEGYGKRFMAADDVEKREDSVKDIGALLDYIKNTMGAEILPDRVAVAGGSYGGYMTYACLVHFSPRLRCGLATCPISDWNAFLKNTAKFRQAHRRREYGDESDPKISEFLKSISPLHHAEKIKVPLLTAHGENDTRVPVEEAIKMWDLVKRNGVHSELIVAEMEGHGFKQKVVIEYCNAARAAFLKKWLVTVDSRTAGSLLHTIRL